MRFRYAQIFAAENAVSPAQLEAVVTEVNELKKSVSDGKTAVAGAITDKGITTATDAAFATMADNIGQISTLATETADATATAAQILSGKRAYVKGSPVVGTMPNNGGPSTAISNGSLKAGYTTGGDIANLTAGNIKQGINIGGIVGSLEYFPSNPSVDSTLVPMMSSPYAATYSRKINCIVMTSRDSSTTSSTIYNYQGVTLIFPGQRVYLAAKSSADSVSFNNFPYVGTTCYFNVTLSSGAFQFSQSDFSFGGSLYISSDLKSIRVARSSDWSGRTNVMIRIIY